MIDGDDCLLFPNSNDHASQYTECQMRPQIRHTTWVNVPNASHVSQFRRFARRFLITIATHTDIRTCHFVHIYYYICSDTTNKYCQRFLLSSLSPLASFILCLRPFQENTHSHRHRTANVMLIQVSTVSFVYHFFLSQFCVVGGLHTSFRCSLSLRMVVVVVVFVVHHNVVVLTHLIFVLFRGVVYRISICSRCRCCCCLEYSRFLIYFRLVQVKTCFLHELQPPYKFIMLTRLVVRPACVSFLFLDNLCTRAHAKCP